MTQITAPMPASRPHVRRRGSVATVLAASVLALVMQALAAAPSFAAGLDQLRAFLTETRSAQGEFTQKVLRANGQTLESTQGVFAFARPGKFRWEVRKPFEQLMVADGERLWFHDKDLNQVTIQKIGAAVGSTPAALLFGSSDLEKAFTLSEQGERDGLEWVEALPRQTDQGFDRIAIGLRDGLPAVMEVRDAFGRTSVFAFDGIQRNPELAASLFRFAPPAGADVIEQK